MEQPPSPDNFRLQANLAIVEQIKRDIFTPTEPEDIAWFQDPSIWQVTYMSSHRATGEELHITYFKDDPRSGKRLPEGLSLPAIMIDTKISDSYRHIISNRVVPTFATTQTREKEYFTMTEYWLDLKGNARRVTSTYVNEGEKPEPEVEIVEDIQEKTESTLLDTGDYEVIEAKLEQLQNGEFEDGEYSGDTSKFS